MINKLKMELAELLAPFLFSINPTLMIVMMIRFSLLYVGCFLFSLDVVSQSINLVPVLGFDVATGRSPIVNIATNPKIISYPVVGLEMSLPKVSEKLVLGATMKFWENISVNPPPFPATPGYEFGEQLISTDIYARIHISDKIAFTGGYFQQTRQNRATVIFGTGPIVDYGISGGVGVNLPNSHVAFKTKVFLNEFSAFIGAENYEIRISSRILSNYDKMLGKKKENKFSEFFRIGLKFFPSYNLVTLRTERDPNVSFLPSLGYEVLNNDIGISLFAEYDLFYRLNFGSSIKTLQQVINTSSFGMKYYFKGRYIHGLFVGASYAYSKHENLPRSSRKANYQIKGIGLHGGYLISDRWSFEVQTLLFLKSGRKRLTDVNYAKLGVIYNLPL